MAEKCGCFKIATTTQHGIIVGKTQLPRKSR